MYLSRVEFDQASRKNLREMNHLGAFHHWVETSFPREIQTGERSRKLWRLDPLGGKLYLLIVSAEKPDLLALERYGVPGTAETKAYDAYLEQLAEGDLLGFRLVANPVVARKIDRKTGEKIAGAQERGKIIPLTNVTEIEDYLLERASRAGFALEREHFTVTALTDEKLMKKQRRLMLKRATFEGQLRITDIAQFRRTLVEGIGRQKAHGFGLLTVVPWRH